MTITDNIRRVRIEKGITQAELAERMHVTPPVISRYEQGAREPAKPETVRKIADALGVPITELYAGTDLYEDIVTAFGFEFCPYCGHRLEGVRK